MTLPIGPGEWTVLDTSIARGLIAGESDAIDPAELSRVRGKHPIALADAAPAEIMDWLLHRAPEGMLARVRPALEKLNPLLDPEFPIAPGGGMLSAFGGLADYSEGRNRRDISCEVKEIWRLLRTIEKREDLTRSLRYRDSTGKERIREFKGPSDVLKTMQDGWMVHDIAQLAQKMATEAAAKGEEYEGLTDAEVERMERNSQRRMANVLRVPPEGPGFERLELQARYFIRCTRIAALPSYKPPKEPSSNPAVDATLLNYLIVPAVISTAEKKFINSVREIPVPDRFRVMSAAELLTWLKTGVLPTGPCC